MEIREEVIECLNERLSNVSAEGKIFADRADYGSWLVGDGEDVEGFLQNPSAALAMEIVGEDSAAPAHPGVTLTTTEEKEISTLLKSLNFGNLSKPALQHMRQEAMVSASFIGPILIGVTGY